jgi:hypothetical protein
LSHHKKTTIPRTNPRPRMALTNSLTNQNSIDSYNSNFRSLFQKKNYFRDNHHSRSERARDTSRPVVIGK